MVTRKDVAKKAGVSPATVSHVINGTKYVSPELKKRVQDAIRELNYRPNMVARSLSTKRTKHVAIVVNNISNPYYGEIAQGMEEVARKYGYMVSLCIAEKGMDEYFTNIIQRQMDGLFIATAEHGFTVEQLKGFEEHGIAIVNGGWPDIGSYVNFDYIEAMDKVIKYLSDMGHRYIGFLSGLSIKDPAHMRYLGYVKALAKYGLKYDPELVVDGIEPYYTTHFTGYESMKKLLARKTRVTAVFATNDLMALGAIKAIRESGLKIPDDISVVGCDDIFLAECSDPPLTTLRAPKKEMGRQAMNLMLAQINENKRDSIILKMDLIIRGSTSGIR